ncbi:MAG: hypothetical protein F4Z72_13060 [Gemmatimonadales bacterium]|nr:hypothetical protein [Candidatus Palauibacter irciniicola]MYC19196.1 hypothetical protein [Gemmatimonadales bacterium]
MPARTSSSAAASSWSSGPSIWPTGLGGGSRPAARPTRPCHAQSWSEVRRSARIDLCRVVVFLSGSAGGHRVSIRSWVSTASDAILVASVSRQHLSVQFAERTISPLLHAAVADACRRQQDCKPCQRASHRMGNARSRRHLKDDRGRFSGEGRCPVVSRPRRSLRLRLVPWTCVALTAAAWAWACGDGAIEPQPAPPRPAVVTVSPAVAEMAALGETVQFSASVSDQNGQALAGTSLSWSITETAVAEVSGSGLVTAVGNGTATITATAGEASGTAAITVDQVVSALAVSPAVGTLWVGDTLRLSAKATDANGHAVEEAEFAWESGDAAIATVDSTGLVTAVGAGEVDVMAASSGVTSRAALSVMAPVPTTVAVTPDTVALTALGQSAQFGAEVRDQAGRVMTDAVVSWTSGDTTVAVVDSTGSVAAVGNGTATITAGAGEASGHAVALVMQSAGSVIVTPGADSITSGDTLRLSARAFDENGHPLVGSTFDWSSSNGSVATVDASGLVRGVAQGTATISARTGSTQGTAQITVSNPDRAALVAFYEQTDGPNWEWDTNWLTDAPLDTWAGIDTNEFDRVTRLRFRSGQINGTLPREIGELSELRHLHIASRNLIGEIPPAIGSLANLESLLLGSRLTGAIPPELGNLANLESLVLGGSLTGEIPPALGDLANLRLLELHSVTSAMPPELGKLASLEVLDLHGNLTGSIPQEIGRLHNLRVLELYDTEPTEAGAGGIPPDLGDLTKLETLKIVRFRLTGPIPAELGRLSNLRVLFLSGTQLTGGIPAELGNLSNLREFVSDGNRFTAPLPPELGRLGNLEELYLIRSQIPGAIPAEFGNLKNLKELELPRNHLTGPVPKELGKLSNLTRLHLNENSLTGGIPRELGGLNELTRLWLRGNELTGEIPPELGNLTNLKQLHLGRNRLTGPIPPELGNLTDLEALYLYENGLTGGVPQELASLTKLWVMSFRKNPGLSGAFPSGFVSLRELVRFYSDDTDLCAPRDAAFLAWLNSVPSQRVKLCGPTDLGAYLTQAVQSDEFPVPLVAGTEALLRVFVTAPRPTSERIPAVRARFFLGDSEIHVADIAAKTTSIPTEIDEGSLSRSSQALIPGSVIQPGLEMVVEIDPAGTLDPALGVRSRIPETGRIVVNVAEMPHFSLTVIPFVWSETSDSSVVASAMGMEADPHGHALLEHTTSLLPIGDLDVTAHAPVVTSSNNVSTILNQTVAIRAIEGGSGNWLGLIAPPVEGRVTGVATLGGGSESASITSSSTIAHELGHNMGLFHAPCGGASWVDTAFPHAKGSIGAWGYDFRGQALIKPDTPDLMSYCRPRWISDYHFGNALRYRLAEQAGTGASRSAAVRSLLLWGGVAEDGIPYLEPAFVMDAPPTMPRNGGAYRLAGHDASGFELFSIQFEMQEVADANEQKSFAFMVPVETDWSLDLANITLSGPEGSVSLDRDTDRPMTILRSLSNGQVRGILRNVSPAVGVQADAGGSGLDLLFSRGMPDVASWRR